MNIYEARRKYIENVGKQLLDYLSKGYIIFSPENEIVEQIITRKDTKTVLSINRVLYYIHNKNTNDGYYTSIKKLREIIRRIKIIKPEHIISIEDVLSNRRK